MSDENIDIVVSEKGDGTNRLTAALNSAATQAEATATSIDKVTAATNEVAPAANTAADAQTKATTAVKGYIDANGSYIRLVGSQRDAVATTAAAQGQLTAAVSSTTIEAGRAAAGYGPLNTSLTSAQSASSAAQAAVVQLTAGLAGGATSAKAAGVGLGEVGASGNAAAVGLAAGRNAFSGVQGAADTAGIAARGAASGLTAAGGAGNGAGNGLGAAATAARGAATAANEAATAHRSLGTALGQVGSSALQIAGVVGGIAAALGVGAVIKAADSWATMSNKLRLVTTDQTKLNAILQQAFEIAQRTSTPVEQVSNTFGKLANVGVQYGISWSQAATITESLSLALQASGASSASAGTALMQFGQGLEKGKLEAQDFKSILEQAPAVQNAMIAGLNRIGVTVNGSLQAALSNGTVSVKQMLNALVAINPTLKDFAATASPTVEQAFIRLDNSFKRFIGTSTETGATVRLISNSLDAVGNNLGVVVPLVAGFAGVLALGAFAAAATAITGFATALGAAAIAAGAVPVALTVGGVALATYALGWTSLGTKIKDYLNGTTAVKPATDTAKAAVSGLTAAAVDAGTSINAAGQTIRTGADGIKTIGSASIAANVEVNTIATSIKNASVAMNDNVRATSTNRSELSALRQATRDAGGGFVEMNMNMRTGTVTLQGVGSAAQATTYQVDATGKTSLTAAENIGKIGSAATTATGSFGTVAQSARNAGGGFVEMAMNMQTGVVTLTKVGDASQTATYQVDAAGKTSIGTADAFRSLTAGAGTVGTATDKVASSSQKTAETMKSAAAAANGWTQANAAGAVSISSAADYIAKYGQAAYDAEMATDATRGSLNSLDTALDASGANADQLSASLKEVATATGSFTSAAEASSAAAKKAADAQKELADAHNKSAAAAKDFNDAINRVQNLNAYGEKLQTTSDFLSRVRASQKAFQASLDESIGTINNAAAAQNQLSIAASGVSDAVAKAAAAAQTGIAGYDQYGQSAAHAAENLKALTGDAGLFTQAELNANSSLNQGQSAMEGAASSAGNLASAFQSAGAAASFLAIQTKNANTVIGQIGTSSGGFSQSYDENFLPLGRGQSGLGQQEIDRQRYSVIQQEEAYKKKLDDMHKQAQRELGVNDNTTAVAQDKVSTAISANTAAVNRNTSATASNTSATQTTLPDLLTSPVTTNIVAGAGPSGIGVGSTATQTTYDAPAAASNVVPFSRGGPAGMADPGIYGTSNPTVSPGMGDPTGLNAVVQAIQDGFAGSKQRPGVANITIKTDDLGQFKRSQRQIGQDLAMQLMGAG